MRAASPEAAFGWVELLMRAPGTGVATALAAAPLLSVFRRLLSESDREAAWPVLAAQGPRGRA